MPTLYLASSNPGKLRELQSLAHSQSRTLIQADLLPDFEQLPAAEEIHASFALNAIDKARHYSRHTEELVCADDSGLAVDALGGAPGVRSARFAGPNATDEDNNRRLVEELRSVPESQRTARYVCVLALARRGELIALFSEKCEGRIQLEPRGRGGFGYDPYFFYPQYEKTLAEVTEEEKNRVSHRGKAFRKLLTYLNR